MNSILRILLGQFVFALILVMGNLFAPSHTCLLGTPAYADTSVIEYGADGGFGLDGGSIDLYNAASGSGDYLSLTQQAFGGNGGRGDSSTACGQGGYASSFLSSLSGAGLGTYSTSYDVVAQGGAGGGNGAFNVSVNGGQGGNAQAGFYLSGPGDISGAARAYGGAGGSLSEATGAGGAGGLGILSSVFGESTTGGSVNLTAGATMGNGGGNAYGSGNGGNAASISMTNNLDGNTSGRLTLRQEAIGGSGGSAWIGNGGLAGSGESRLIYSKNTSSLTLETQGAGGSGGGVGWAGNGKDGATGTAYTEAANTGIASASATAGGGSGGSVNTWDGYDPSAIAGHGAAANAEARATSSASYADAGATARGGDGGRTGAGSQGGAGGAADAIAVATTGAPESGYGGSAWSAAYGGAGGHAAGSGAAGGLATASSTYNYAGSQDAGASVSAYAQGGAGGQAQQFSGGAGGGAIAMATGNAPNLTGLSVSSVAYGGQGGYSYSGDHGRGGEAQALSTGTALSGIVSSSARTYMQAPEVYGVQAQAAAFIDNGTTTTLAATTTGQIKALAEVQGKQAAAFGTILPDQAGIDSLFAMHQKVASVFEVNSTVLGYGALRTATSNDSYTITSSLEYFQNTANLSNPGHLMVGLFDSSFTGSGFVSLEFSISSQGAGNLFDRIFYSPDAALSFFNDEVIDLGLLTALTAGDLIFNSTLIAGSGSAFDFNFIQGSANPVPVPGAVWLLGSGLLGLWGWRRSFKRN